MKPNKLVFSSVFALIALLGSHPVMAQNTWLIEDDGIVRRSPRGCEDYLSMGSRGLDAIVEWSVSSDGAWSRKAFATFPTLRVGKEGIGVDSTRGSWRVPFDEAGPASADGRPLSTGVVSAVRIGATVKVEIRHDEGLEETREIFPANTARALLERVVIDNVSDRVIEVTPPHDCSSLCATGVFGKVVCERRVYGPSVRRLAPGCRMTYVHVLSGRGENDAPYTPDAATELAARKARWHEAAETLVLETPVPEIDRMFLNAKFHSLESLYFTRGGLIHSPGGYGNYLGAIWTNDEIEYANPLLVMLGAESATEAAFTCCRWFARMQNPEFRPIEWSIVSEGRFPFSFKKDRGDQAMMAHGMTRTALASGDRRFAEEIEPFIAWCLEYGRRRLTADGVVASESDELEGRLPSGDANLNTNSLQYDGLLRAADLLDALGKDPARAADYRARAARLAEAIERHFGGVVEGYDCYRYYQGNDKLRSWIATPLCFGIDRRAEAVGKAVFSPSLWNGIGLRSVTGEEIYWDRSALYAFRGLFFCGQSDNVLPHLTEYTRMRLLGDHVPYPIEAFPEFKGSHLAAESALYCRIFTEGLFGLTPTGFDSFRLRPNLPSSWNRAALRNVRAFGSEFDLDLTRVSGGVRVTVSEGRPAKPVFSKVVKPGASIDVRAPGESNSVGKCLHRENGRPRPFLVWSKRMVN